MENTLKKEKKQHDHKLTKLLKVGIFSIVMLAPFIAIASKIAYTTFNKNAHLSYYGKTINETNYNDITNVDQINVNDTYKFYAQAQQEYTQNGNITFQINNFVDYDNLQLSETPYKITFYVANNYVQVQFLNQENTLITQKSNANQTFNFDFNYISSNGTTPLEETLQYLKIKTINKNSYLDNTFYYAVDQLQESELFNWTQNTTIYSGIYGLTNGMGNNNPTIAILLTYWTITTCIYVIFDIIIELFTWLTHLIGER